MRLRRTKEQKKIKRERPYTLEDLQKYFAFDAESAALVQKDKRESFDPEERKRRRAKNKVARLSRKANR